MEGKPLVASCDVALFAKLAAIVFAHPPYPECRFLIAIRLSGFRTSQCDLVHIEVLSWPFRTLCADRRRGEPHSKAMSWRPRGLLTLGLSKVRRQERRNDQRRSAAVSFHHPA